MPKTYFFDGSISGYQENSGDTVSKLWIYPTMRRGGNMIYAFNAKFKPSSSSGPTPMWRFGCATPATNCATNVTGESNMGQSWSAPAAIRVEGHAEPLVVFGAGYHTCEDSEDPSACASITQGRGVYVLNASQGTSVTGDYRNFTFDSTGGRFIADIATADINGDGYIDVLYAVDTRGNIWRINTSDPTTNFKGYENGVADWPVPVKVATVSDWASPSERRKFMYAPSVVVLGTQTLVLVGTGDREKPSATSSAASVNNRFYGIRDDVTKTTAATVTTINGSGATTVSLPHLTDLVNVTNQTTIDKAAMATRKGWFMDLSSPVVPPSSPAEQVVTTPLTIAGTTYFSTYQAKKTDGANSCSNLGTGRAYKIDFETGIGKPNTSNQLSPDIFLSQGIPPSPVGGLVSIDGKTYPFCIGCSGPSVLTPTNPLVPVRPNRKPIYRYQKVDK